MEWLFPAIMAVVMLFGVLIHRRLARLRMEAVRAWPPLEAKLRQRHELIAQLARAFNRLPEKERRPARAMIKARDAAALADLSPAATGVAEQALAKAIDQALSLALAQPELLADPQVQRLVPLMQGLEQEITQAGATFNHAALAFNRASFGSPGILVAKITNLHPVEYFARDNEERGSLHWQATGQAL